MMRALLEEDRNDKPCFSQSKSLYKSSRVESSYLATRASICDMPHFQRCALAIAQL